MKKLFPLLILSTLLMNSCDLKSEYISFKEFTETISNAKDGQKDIVFFTASNCSSCHQIAPLVEKFKAQNNDENLNIHILTVDHKSKMDGSVVFKDTTMGYITGNINNDCIKRLDNRIIEYCNVVFPDNNYPNYLFKGSANDSNYLFVYTPLIIWYDSGIEVKIANNCLRAIESDFDGNLKYESFADFMKFPEENPTWNKEFDLNYYSTKK